MLDIVRSYYQVDEDAETTAEKIQYLGSLNSSTVNKLKEIVLQNWSYSTQNETIEEISENEGTSSGYSMKFWLRITWDLLFFIIIFVSIVGNLLVLWIVTGKVKL